MAIKKEEFNPDAVIEKQEDLIKRIKEESIKEAMDLFRKEQSEKEQLIAEKEKNKKLWGYSITLSYNKYYSVHKNAEFLINGEQYIVPQGEPTEVPLSIIEILDEHALKNKNNPDAIMFRYVKNNPVLK